jgi:hypothetical protein
MNRSYFILFAAGCLLLSGCKYAQLIYVSPSKNNVKDIGEVFVCENDTVAVKYYFWANRGIMAFSVFNKLDIPIYIDWKKSSFIDKNKKKDYYQEKETKNSATVSVDYAYHNVFDWSRFFGTAVVGGSIGSEVSIKEERITFIPPKSYIIRNDFNIVPDVPFFKWDEAEKRSLPIPNDTTKKFSVYITKADESSPAFVFRNFLTYSTKENFVNEYYINDEFFIRKVLTMKESTFLQYYESDARRFYILIRQSQ